MRPCERHRSVRGLWRCLFSLLAHDVVVIPELRNPGPGLVARPADSWEVVVACFDGFEFGLLRFFVLRVLLFRVIAVHANGLCIEHRHCGDVRWLVATVAVLHE